MLKKLKELKMIENGKIKGWVWVAAWSVIFMIMFVGLMFSDTIAARVSKNQMVLGATIPIILGTYAYSQSNKRKSNINQMIGSEVMKAGADGIPKITRSILKKGERDDGSGREGD